MSASGCLSQTAAKRCDNTFVFSPCVFYDPLFSLFSLFFCSFPQGLAHLMLKSQGMGPCPLLFSFFFPSLSLCFLNSFPSIFQKKKLTFLLFALFSTPTPVPPLPFLSRPYPAGSVSSHSLLCVSVCPSCAPHPCPVHWPSPRTCSTEGHCSCR